jgi:hypothetical protein
MVGFGKRILSPSSDAAASVTQHMHAPSAGARRAALAMFAVLAAVTAAHVWISILQVPWERPVGALFSARPASKQGWAAWYFAPIFSALLALLLLHLYFRRPRRWSLLGLAVAGAAAILFGAWGAYWVKNIGYAWYFLPGTTIGSILGAQPYMAPANLWNALDLAFRQPLLVSIGAMAGVVAALALHLPVRAAAPVGRAHDDPPAGQIALPATRPRAAGWPARLITAALMALVGGTLASLDQAYLLAKESIVDALLSELTVFRSSMFIIVTLMTGLIFFFVSFRNGRHAFGRVLAGSAAMSLLSLLPIATAMTIALGLAGVGVIVAPLLTAAIMWTPLYLLLSIGLIKLALLLSHRPRS